MPVKTTTPKKPDPLWVSKDVLASSEYKAVVDEEGVKLCRSANAAVNALTKQQLSWHCRYWGNKAPNGRYMGGIYTMTQQAVAHRNELL